MMSFSLHASKCNFICKSEVSRPLTVKFGPKGEKVVLISNATSKLKTKQLQTISDDIISVPDMLQTDRAKFSESVRGKFGIWRLFCSNGDLPNHIENGTNRPKDYVIVTDHVIMTSSICKQQ